MADTTVNIPQIIVLCLIAFLVVRWATSRSASASAQSANRNGGRRVDERSVDQILQMFPQLGRREVVWDLMRTGGSLAATSERILSGRGLDTPPPSFQPPPAPGSTPTPAQRQPKKPQHPDLITRYNLTSKLEEEKESEEDLDKKATWSANKSERQALMQKKREEMILRARRKLMEKDRDNVS
ncbi:MAG: hypothetical protein M1824_003276 [Vezdaea acicularis]|nr:MAG: hypothetical protein M1824_003276 [Vezdaea acicularis]